uniref:HTH OST-type domain-containing protein n=1 Tax=Anopheles stephensi TaxID=30069 RepID=A0A182XZU2_ANOST
MSGSFDELAKLKPIIRSLVMSHRNQSITVKELERDFREMEGFPIPYKQLGFTNLFNLLNSMPDIVQVTIRNGYPVVTYVTAPAVEHVAHLVQRNKRGRASRGRLGSSPKRYNPRAMVSRTESVTAAHHYEMEQGSTPVSYAQQIRETMPVMSNANEECVENPCSTDNRPAVVEAIRSTENEPAAVERNSSAGNQSSTGKEEIYDSLEESCEHVGTMMGRVPSTDEWDLVNMMGLSPDVMQLGHTIPKTDVAYYFDESEEIHVRIQHIFNPNRIWLRSVAQDAIMMQLTRELHECYDRMYSGEWCLEPSHVQHGMYCAAQIDRIWYRARIVGPLIGTNVKLFFIDTGLVENVNYKSLKFLFKTFGSVPTQAIRASLACLLGVLDIILIDRNTNNLNETFASAVNAQWNGVYFLTQSEGHFPTLDELRRSQMRHFDFEEYYTRIPYFEQNGVVECISRETNAAMVKLYGIVSVKDEQEMELDLTSRNGTGRKLLN